MKIAKKIDLSAERNDILATLSIAALLHQTNEGVSNCAKQLLKTAPRSICKSILYGLAESTCALEVVIDEIIYPTQEMEIGHVTLNEYQYDLYAIYRGPLEYNVEEIVELVTKKFIQHGIVKGRLYMAFRYLFRRGNYSTSVDMAEASRYREAA